MAGLTGRLTAFLLVAVLAAPAAASAQLPVPLPVPGPNAGAAPHVQPYRTADATGFRDVLPPGTRGLYNAPELGAFLAGGRTVPHCCDQLQMYGDLVYATPGLAAEDVSKYFKDASFGVAADQAERTYAPRGDVTIVRDKAFGVPHVYGADRDGAMFGLGYAAAEDRLFFMDVLRHAGRGELASFAGGSNAGMDIETWESAPYTEADLQRQADQLDDLYGPDGATVQRDVAHYIAGVNQYIAEARLNPLKLPGEYAAIGKAPENWKATDVIATAGLVGGIFGKGGGLELEMTEVAEALRARFGRHLGTRVFRDFRSAEDPEAPVTVLGRKRFPYQAPPKKPAKGSVAIWDANTLQRHEVVSRRTGAGGGSGTLVPRGLAARAFPAGGSNALLVSGRESVSGHPLMVAGPQTGYFTPQILMEQDVHAPAASGKPGIDARGASFIGVNLYVQLGRGRDYAWSATSAGQDNIDTFALELCEPGGGPATKQSMHYRFRRECLPIEVLQKESAWTPNPGDQTPAGSMTLRAERTRLGLVAARAAVDGKPVIFTKLRSTYFHEVDSAVGFLGLNTPERVRSAQDFQREANRIGYTFNWFYADSERIAYFNSGANPVRAKRVAHDHPVWGERRFEWRGWNPDAWTARYTRFAQHPQAFDQRYLVNWNNKQARGYRASDSARYSSVYRSDMLEDRVRRAIRGPRKLTLPGLIDIMEVAGTGDLRAHAALPLALRILGKPKDPQLAAARDKLAAWRRAGGLRKDANRDGAYEHSEAIAIMDAWWPRWVRAQFEPRLGAPSFAALTKAMDIDNAPNNHGQHLGSAYQGGWYGYVRKDLRTVLGERVRGRYAVRYCGNGSRAACRRALAGSLRAALAVPRDELYGGDQVCADEGKPADQWCFDAVRQRPVGGATQPLIHWINRPTYQQANEIQARVPR
jgi:acyl-homoserine lactone acylase PvdQ